MFRPVIRNLILNSLGTFFRPSNSIHILNGHYASINNDFNKEKFRSFLNKINTFCDFIDFDKAIDLIVNEQKVDKPLLAFSFDDGFFGSRNHTDVINFWTDVTKTIYTGFNGHCYRILVPICHGSLS